MEARKRLVLEAIISVALWVVWRFQNELVFGEKPLRRDCIFDSVIDLFYS